jgi:hypothetical protein
MKCFGIMCARKIVSALIFTTIIHLTSPQRGWAQEEELPRSPKPGWGDFEVVEEPAPRPWWAAALLWVPNRLLDAVDIFRVDAGVGPAYGGVVRVTKYAQFGYRSIRPFSLRAGDFGRTWPVKLESSNEFGAGPAFIQSKDRNICSGELGLGLDLLIVGAYGGVCVEEIVDFAAGLFFLDIMDDDIE